MNSDGFSYMRAQNVLGLLDSVVETLTRRHHHRLYVRSLLDALFWGLVASAIAVFCIRRFNLPYQALIVASVLLIVAVSIGALLAWQRQAPKLSVAIAADQQLGLKQSLSTAWEFREIQPDSTLTHLLAAQAVRGRYLTIKRVFAFKLNIWGMLLPLGVVLLVLATLVDLHTPQTIPSSTVDKLVVQEGQRLSEFAKRMKQRAQRKGLPRSLTESITLQELATDMKTAQVERAKAVRRLQRLTRSIAKQRLAAAGVATSGSEYDRYPQAPLSADAIDGAGIGHIRDRLSSGELSTDDLRKLNKAAQGMNDSGKSTRELKQALDRFARGETEDLQRLLDQMVQANQNIEDEAQLARAEAAVARARENLGDERSGESPEFVQSDGTQQNGDSEQSDTGSYTLSELPGMQISNGSGQSSNVAPFNLPGADPQDITADNDESRVTLQTKGQLNEGDSFKTTTWALPEIGTPSVKPGNVDVQFKGQMEAVLSRENYPLHRKEFVRRYFLNLSNRSGVVTATGEASK